MEGPKIAQEAGNCALEGRYCRALKRAYTYLGQFEHGRRTLLKRLAYSHLGCFMHLLLS